MGSVLGSDLEPDLRALAERWVAAMEAGDADTFLQQFTPNGVVWLSYAGAEVTAEQNAGLLGRLFAQAVDALTYDDIRWSGTATGFLQQHTLHIRAKSGATFTAPACAVVEVTGGLISRSSEYVDSSITRFAAVSGLTRV